MSPKRIKFISKEAKKRDKQRAYINFLPLYDLSQANVSLDPILSAAKTTNKSIAAD